MPRSARPSATARADGDADRRIVDRRLAVGAVVVDGVAEPLKRLLEMLFQEKAGVIGADRDAHRRANCRLIGFRRSVRP